MRPFSTASETICDLPNLKISRTAILEMNIPVCRIDQAKKESQVPGYDMRQGGENKRLLDTPQFESHCVGRGVLCPLPNVVHDYVHPFAKWRPTSAGSLQLGLQATEPFRGRTIWEEKKNGSWLAGPILQT